MPALRLKGHNPREHGHDHSGGFHMGGFHMGGLHMGGFHMSFQIGARLRLHLLMVAACLAGPVPAMAQAQAQEAAAAGPVGEWLVEKGLARIRIVDCGSALWGVVSWEAKPGTDHENPDPSLRSRPTLGMPVLLGMTESRPNRWDGKIYNSENGKTYTASISLKDPDTLRVQGCVFSVLCGGQDWTRFAAPETPAAAAPSAPATRGRMSRQAEPPPEPSPNSAEAICSRVGGAAGFSH